MRSPGGSEAFLISGVTTAFLKSTGTTLSDREQLTSLVIEGSRMSRHSLTKKVGHGSIRQDFVGDFLIAFWISSSETVLKESKLGRSGGAGSLKESVLENESLILVILSEK